LGVENICISGLIKNLAAGYAEGLSVVERFFILLKGISSQKYIFGIFRC